MKLHRRDRTLDKSSEYSVLPNIFGLEQIKCRTTAKSVADKQTGDSVTLWEDMSSRHYDFKYITAGSAPTYQSTGFNGLPSLRFTSGTFVTDYQSQTDGGYSAVWGYMHMHSPGAYTTYPGQCRTMAMVYIPRTTYTGIMFSNYFNFRNTTSPRWYVSSSMYCYAATSVAIGEPVILIASNQGRFERLWMNGVPQNNIYFPGGTWMSDQLITRPTLQGGTYDLGEVFMARVSIGPKEVIMLNDYFCKQWGITTPTPTWPAPT
jgi:hypothetical protein